MNHDGNGQFSPETGDFRRRALKRMRVGPVDVGRMSRGKIQELVYELQVHQEELEIIIEDLRYTQEQLTYARNDYAALFDFAPVGYLTLDAGHMITRANLTAAALFDRDRRDLEGLPVALLAVPKDRDACHIYLRAIPAGSTNTTELRFLHADREFFWARLYGACIESHAGECGGYRLAVSDITEQKRTAEALLRSEQHYRLLYEESPAIHMIVGLDGSILDVNKQALDLLGYRRKEVIGRPLTRFILPQQSDYITRRFTEAMEKKVPLPQTDISVLTADKEVRRLMIVSGGGLLEGRDEPHGYLLSALDVTERTRMEQELKMQTDKLIYANNEMESFIYSVSHDLRTPLRTIFGFIEIIKEDYGHLFDDTGRCYLQRIFRIVTTMRDLIDDMLRLSRVSRHELHLDAVNLSEMVKTILAQLQSENPRERTHINVQKSVIVHADSGLMRIVMHNLLQNAWKYTQKNETTVIEFGTREQDGTPVCFISDNGTGFEQKDAEKIFNPFQRLHAGADYPGTGVGLAIVKRVVTRHGGSVWAKAAPGKGTIVYFNLPGPGSQAALG